MEQHPRHLKKKKEEKKTNHFSKQNPVKSMRDVNKDFYKPP